MVSILPIQYQSAKNVNAAIYERTLKEAKTLTKNNLQEVTRISNRYIPRAIDFPIPLNTATAEQKLKDNAYQFSKALENARSILSNPKDAGTFVQSLSTEPQIAGSTLSEIAQFNRNFPGFERYIRKNVSELTPSNLLFFWQRYAKSLVDEKDELEVNIMPRLSDYLYNALQSVRAKVKSLPKNKRLGIIRQKLAKLEKQYITASTSQDNLETRIFVTELLSFMHELNIPSTNELSFIDTKLRKGDSLGVINMTLKKREKASEDMDLENSFLNQDELPAYQAPLAFEMDLPAALNIPLSNSAFSSIQKSSPPLSPEETKTEEFAPTRAEINLRDEVVRTIHKLGIPFTSQIDQSSLDSLLNDIDRDKFAANMLFESKDLISKFQAAQRNLLSRAVDHSLYGMPDEMERTKESIMKFFELVKKYNPSMFSFQPKQPEPQLSPVHYYKPIKPPTIPEIVLNNINKIQEYTSGIFTKPFSSIEDFTAALDVLIRKISTDQQSFENAFKVKAYLQFVTNYNGEDFKTRLGKLLQSPNNPLGSVGEDLYNVLHRLEKAVTDQYNKSSLKLKSELDIILIQLHHYYTQKPATLGFGLKSKRMDPRIYFGESAAGNSYYKKLIQQRRR